MKTASQARQIMIEELTHWQTLTIEQKQSNQLMPEELIYIAILAAGSAAIRVSGEDTSKASKAVESKVETPKTPEVREVGGTGGE